MRLATVSLLTLGALGLVWSFAACGGSDPSAPLPGYADGGVPLGEGGTDTGVRTNDGGGTDSGDAAGEAGPLNALGCSASIAAGAVDACAVDANGGLWCFGANGDGQLGIAGKHTAALPTRVAGLPPVTSLALGTTKSCAAVNGGHVWCWGSTFGATPVVEPGIDQVKEVVAGERHVCALRTNGEVWCWGEDTVGQTGGATGTPGQLPGLPTVTGIAAGARHTCALGVTGDVYCWGGDDARQLGSATLGGSCGAGGCSNVPVQVIGVAGATAIAAGGTSTCVVRADKGIACWGGDDVGQLGDGQGTGAAQGVPVVVPGIADARSVVVGGNFACAVSGSGGASCWGGNEAGQLGRDTLADRFGERTHVAPGGVTAVTGAVASLAAGGDFACARRVDGSVACFGDNSYGTLGSGVSLNRATPSPVAGLAGITQVAAGGAFTCARTTAGSLSCWGYGRDGQLGNAAFANSGVPVAVSGLTGVLAVAVGTSSACAITASHTLSCWGDNSDGELGNATPFNSATPTAVPAVGSAASSVAVGDRFACALRTAGTVTCFGKGDRGQLGTSISGDHTAIPQDIGPLGSTVTKIGAGLESACALKSDGTVWCWGDDFVGQLGSAAQGGFSASPLEVTALGTDVVDLVVGNEHACALKKDGTLWCWGWNAAGQLGDGTLNGSSFAPVQVATLASTTSTFALGGQTTFAIDKTGATFSWGDAVDGELANGVVAGPGGNTADTAFPIPSRVTALASEAEIALGGSFGCARATDGTVVCWGNDTLGQLGDGHTRYDPRGGPVLGSSACP